MEESRHRDAPLSDPIQPHETVPKANCAALPATAGAQHRRTSLARTKTGRALHYQGADIAQASAGSADIDEPVVIGQRQSEGPVHAAAIQKRQ